MEATTFVLFGATGDLAKRKIYPALYNLFVDRKLPESFSVIGLGRREWSDETFQHNVEQAIRTFSRRKADDSITIAKFIKSFRYCVLNIGHAEDYKRLLTLVEEQEQLWKQRANRVFYLSVGPEFFEPIAANIKASGLSNTTGWKRLMIEKPFGHDLASAQHLNQQLSESFEEDEIYRIDHYLGKPMVQELDVLQQTNPILNALWSNRYISNVQITANETVGVEERAGYYDHVGAVRDMFQNHMLQLMMMLAIRLPKYSSPQLVRNRKKEVMERLVPLAEQDVSANIIRGQYTDGIIQDKSVPGYTSEPGIPAGSRNDTFIAARLQIDDTFWRGVPFYIRTGKRLHEKSTRIVIEFQEPLKQSVVEEEEHIPNLLMFEISPNEGITLQLKTKDPQNKGKFKPMHIQFHTSSSDVPEAYENLIYDGLRGDPSFFAHWNEVELSWKWVQPILNAFEKDSVPLYHYKAGTYGPAESDQLLAQDGHKWWFDEALEQETEVPLALSSGM